MKMASYFLIFIGAVLFYEGRIWADTTDPTSQKRTSLRFSHSASLGVTHVHHTENFPDSINIHQAMLTLKYKASYWLNQDPEKRETDISFSGFLTALPLSKTVSGIPTSSTPRYYGLSLRMGQLLSSESNDFSHLTWKLSGGMSFWGMAIPDNSYGMSTFLGPQAVLSLTGQTTENHRVWGGYIKYAAISDKLTVLSLDSNELGAGGLIEITHPYSDNPISLTLDISRIRTHFIEVTNQINILSTTLGIQYVF